MSAVSDVLRSKAAIEEEWVRLARDDSWPEHVECTYHRGRSSAFREAAEISDGEAAQPPDPSAMCAPTRAEACVRPAAPPDRDTTAGEGRG